MRPERRIVFFAIRSAGHATRIAVGASVAAIVIRTRSGTCASAGYIRFQWRFQQRRHATCHAAQRLGSRSAVRSDAACAGKQYHAASANDTAEQWKRNRQVTARLAQR